MRSIKGQPFLLMESTPSQTNWQSISKLKKPGMHFLSSLHAVAHGTDSVQYFQWRKSRGASKNDEAFYKDFYDELMKKEMLYKPFKEELPEGVVVTERRKDNEKYLFIQNYTKELKSFSVDKQAQKEIELEPFAMILLKES